jgi:hypothetical protein
MLAFEAADLIDPGACDDPAEDVYFGHYLLSQLKTHRTANSL